MGGGSEAGWLPYHISTMRRVSAEIASAATGLTGRPAATRSTSSGWPEVSDSGSTSAAPIPPGAPSVTLGVFTAAMSHPGTAHHCPPETDGVGAKTVLYLQLTLFPRFLQVAVVGPRGRKDTGLVWGKLYDRASSGKRGKRANVGHEQWLELGGRRRAPCEVEVVCTSKKGS